MFAHPLAASFPHNGLAGDEEDVKDSPENINSRFELISIRMPNVIIYHLG